MPTPSPTPTANQIELTAEIMMIDSSEVSDIISDYDQTTANAKWALTLTDIENWGDVSELNDVKKVGSIEFFENKSISLDNRLDFRNKVRLRYGLEALSSDQSTPVIEGSLAWF